MPDDTPVTPSPAAIPTDQLKALLAEGETLVADVTKTVQDFAELVKKVSSLVEALRNLRALLPS